MEDSSVDPFLHNNNTKLRPKIISYAQGDAERKKKFTYNLEW